MGIEIPTAALLALNRRSISVTSASVLSSAARNATDSSISHERQGMEVYSISLARSSRWVRLRMACAASTTPAAWSAAPAASPARARSSRSGKIPSPVWASCTASGSGCVIAVSHSQTARCADGREAARSRGRAASFIGRTGVVIARLAIAAHAPSALHHLGGALLGVNGGRRFVQA